MGEVTGIGWCDHTFNSWWGCEKVDRACKFCYAEVLAKRFVKYPIWGAKTVRKTEFAKGHWAEPLSWNKKWEGKERKGLVFSASMSDVFEDHPDVINNRHRLFDLIEATPNLIWLILSKRPENIQRMIPSSWDEKTNVWFGTSLMKPDAAKERVYHLKKIKYNKIFLSCEPLFYRLDFKKIGAVNLNGSWTMDWVIAGGESGMKAEPMNPEHARYLRDQCQHYNIPFFFKQWGKWKPCDLRESVEDDFQWKPIKDSDEIMYHEPKYRNIPNILDGVYYEQFPNRS
jgi:protein gp37